MSPGSRERFEARPCIRGKIVHPVVERIQSPTPLPSPALPSDFMSPPPAKFAKSARKKAKPRAKVKRKDPIYIDGVRPRPMYVDYKDLELLGKLVNRQAKIIGRRKSGCTAASQHAVTSAIKRARFMALLPYVGE